MPAGPGAIVAGQRALTLVVGNLLGGARSLRALVVCTGNISARPAQLVAPLPALAAAMRSTATFILSGMAQQASIHDRSGRCLLVI
jgi:hypothetical protein